MADFKEGDIVLYMNKTKVTLAEDSGDHSYVCIRYASGLESYCAVAQLDHIPKKSWNDPRVEGCR